MTKILQELKDHFAQHPLIVSDMVDGLGNQYVDLVQEGGGVWGVALLGYTYVLEEMGIRFASMAGTSAGAINTLLLAAAAKPEMKRTQKVLPFLANKNLFDFVDGNLFSRMTVRGVVREEPKALLAMRAVLNYPRLRRRLGLNPGTAFKTWLAHTIEQFDIRTYGELKARMNDFREDLRHRVSGESDPDMRRGKLALIAAEIETGSKVRFPEAARLFFPDPMQTNPAEFVRASMSIPLFFDPVIIRKDQLPKASKEEWQELAGYYGATPKRAVLVDGGILSNFPIDVFHRHGSIPLRPTLGVKLMTFSKRYRESENVRPLRLGSFLGGNFSAARHLRDHEFIFSNPDYQKLVAEIDVGEHNWINFGISEEDKLDLFVRGVRAAQRFLTEFDWEEYKVLRANLIVKAIRRRKASAQTATGKAGEILRNAMEIRQISMPQGNEDILLDRMEEFGRAEPSYPILWIDDKNDRNLQEKDLIRELGPGVTIHEVHSSEEARKALHNNNYKMVISDILREGNSSEGVDFMLEMFKEGLHLPTIFYINNFDPSRGVPMGAFGITDSPAELLHLVMDAISRQGIRKTGKKGPAVPRTEPK